MEQVPYRLPYISLFHPLIFSTNVKLVEAKNAASECGTGNSEIESRVEVSEDFEKERPRRLHIQFDVSIIFRRGTSCPLIIFLNHETFSGRS